MEEEEPEEPLIEGEGKAWGKPMEKLSNDPKDKLIKLKTYGLNEQPPLTRTRAEMCSECSSPYCDGDHAHENHDICDICNRCIDCGDCECDNDDSSHNECGYCSNCTGCEDYGCRENWCNNCERCTSCCTCEEEIIEIPINYQAGMVITENGVTRTFRRL